MRAKFEYIDIARGHSIRVYHRLLEQIPFEWHYHPQYELTLTLNSRGWRFIGEHCDAYAPGDLVLVPPGLPHSWYSTARQVPEDPHEAIVVWFERDWAQQLARVLPEYAPCEVLWTRADQALSFSAETARHLLATCRTHLLDDAAPVRLQALLDALLLLARDNEATVLTQASACTAMDHAPSRLGRVLQLLERDYAQRLTIDELCQAASLSPRSLHRLFTRHMGMNVRDYLLEIRLRHACQRLVEQDWPISRIADSVGFANLSNFNRLFRQRRSMTPREYRHRFRSLCIEQAPHSLRQRPFSLES